MANHGYFSSVIAIHRHDIVNCCSYQVLSTLFHFNLCDVAAYEDFTDKVEDFDLPSTMSVHHLPMPKMFELMLQYNESESLLLISQMGIEIHKLGRTPRHRFLTNQLFRLFDVYKYWVRHVRADPATATHAIKCAGAAFSCRNVRIDPSFTSARTY